MDVAFLKARLSLFIVKVKTNMYGAHANFKPPKCIAYTAVTLKTCLHHSKLGLWRRMPGIYCPRNKTRLQNLRAFHLVCYIT